MSEKIDVVLQQAIHILFLGLFFFLPLVFWIPNSEVFELPKMYFVYAMTALITGLWLARMMVRREILIRRTPLDIPILLFLLSQIISTIYSIDPHISWYGWYGRFNGGLLSTISYTLLYYAFLNNRFTIYDLPARNASHSEAGGRFMKKTIILSAFLVSGYAILQHFGIDRDFWVQDVMNRVFSTLGQPNWLAAYIVALIFIPISNLLNFQFLIFNFQSIFNLLIFNLLFIALLFTKSRSGLLGFAVADIVFWLTVFAKIGTRDKGQGLKVKFLTIHAIIATLIIFTNNPIRTFLSTISLQSSSLSLQPLALSPIKSGSGGTESGDIRRIVWNGALKIAKQNPIFGTGPETFGLTYWQVRPKEANQTSEWNFLYNKAHNEWLNLAANTGLFGLGTHLFLLGWFCVWVLKGLALPKQGQALLNYAILAALLGVETINFFGFSTVAIGAYRYLFMAVAIGTRNKGQGLKEKPSALSPLPLALSLILSLTVLYLLSRIYFLFAADLKYNLGRQLNNAGYMAESLEPLSQAVNLAPNEPVFRNELAETQAMLAISLSAETLAQSSLANFKIVSGQSKFNLIFVRTQAQMEFLMREIDPDLTGEALILAQRAIYLSPTDPRGYYLLGRMYGELGEKIRAEKLYHQALELKPDFEEARKMLNTE